MVSHQALQTALRKDVPPAVVLLAVVLLAVVLLAVVLLAVGSLMVHKTLPVMLLRRQRPLTTFFYSSLIFLLSYNFDLRAYPS